MFLRSSLLLLVVVLGSCGGSDQTNSNNPATSVEPARPDSARR